ncbi:RNA helicase [Plakobranchus ocellatus]|uniref:RNA helicase n=1 Tax=Plakobranchus ocellatus TaxID=259542 RepID=A0AAV4C3S2_9GAST|nr:RNA helicase [Plakobranchus ocellatus]
MATIKCPAPGCDAEWPLATPTDVLTRLLDIHSATAHAASTHVHAPMAAKAEKVRRPTITASGTSEEWAYFLHRWADYKQATRLTGSDIMNTRQMVYFTTATDRMFLSKQACIALGMIPPSFPTIGETSSANCVPAAPPTETQTPQCNCPRRRSPPPPPTSLPFAATEGNRERLEKWLLDFYGSSTFNVCEHQALPKMSGPPIRLMVDPDAHPTSSCQWTGTGIGV